MRLKDSIRKCRIFSTCKQEYKDKNRRKRFTKSTGHVQCLALVPSHVTNYLFMSHCTQNCSSYVYLLFCILFLLFVIIIFFNHWWWIKIFITTSCTAMVVLFSVGPFACVSVCQHDNAWTVKRYYHKYFHEIILWSKEQTISKVAIVGEWLWSEKEDTGAKKTSLMLRWILTTTNWNLQTRNTFNKPFFHPQHPLEKVIQKYPKGTLEDNCQWSNNINR